MPPATAWGFSWVATGREAQNGAVDEEGRRLVDRQTGISKREQGRKMNELEENERMNERVRDKQRGGDHLTCRRSPKSLDLHLVENSGTFSTNRPSVWPWIR